jgi:hypothetical protein
MKLYINLELCQWKQSFYVDTEPEMNAGVLSFTGVNFFQIEPISFLVDSNEILNVKVTSDKSVEIILTGVDDVGIIKFEAQEVNWNDAIE